MKMLLSSESLDNTYLLRLATQQHVGAATHNQAFSALLFVYREVLRLPDADLETGVRAKQGTRLPVVLTFEEVDALLERLEGAPRLMADVKPAFDRKLKNVLDQAITHLDAAIEIIMNATAPYFAWSPTRPRKSCGGPAVAAFVQRSQRFAPGTAVRLLTACH
jgi:hypothetical protein